MPTANEPQSTWGPLLRVSGRRKLVFALAAAFLSAAFTIGALLALDVYLHHKFAEFAGLNVWGYRGPTVGRKQSREQRVFVIGGSTTFGYGVGWSDAFPAALERRLQEDARASGAPVSVVNLAYNNEGAFSFLYTLHDYEYLQPDAVIFYTGYNDGGPSNTSAFRHESAIFQLTGYMPILPVILPEKAKSLRYGGDLDAAYRQEKTAFRPDLADRTSVLALETAEAISKSIERQLGRLTERPRPAAVVADASGCGEPFTRYCDSVRRAVEDVLDHGRDVVVVGQPYISDLHVDQQRALDEMLGKRFAAHPGLRLVNLGNTVNLKDRTLAFDGMHLTVSGNEVIADSLVPVIRDVLAQRRTRPSR